MAVGSSKIALWLFVVATAVVLLMPTLVMLPLSVTTRDLLVWPPHGFSWKWYRVLFTDPQWRAAIATSVEVASWTAAASVVLGALTALGLTRASFRGRALANMLVISPMIVPLVIIA